MPLARKTANKTKRRSGIPLHCGTRGQSKLKAKPAPDFTKLHAKWQNQCDQRKAGLKPCTQIQEFHLSTPGLRKESSVPRPSSRPAVSLTRHHLHSQSHHREERPGRTASSSSQSDDVDFVPENESLQSILSNTGISTATTFPPNQRQTLAVAPTFKTPFAVNEPRQSIYYTGPRNGDPVGLGESNAFSEYQRHLSSRLNMESAAASRASVSSPLLRGPIALPQRQSIYKKYVFPEPVGCATTDAARNIEVPSTLPRARRVPVTATSSPALRTLSKSSAKKRVQWNDLDRHRTLTPDTKKDTVVTMLTFNDEASTSTSSSRVTRLAVEGVGNLKKDDEANVDQVMTGHSSANGDVIHQVEPVVESHSLKEPPTPLKVQFGLHPSSPSEGRRNRQVPKHYIPNVLVDVSNSPEGHFSPGITGILPSEYFGAIPKPPFFTGVDSSPKVYQARSIPETSTDKENLSPYISTFDPQSRPHGTVSNLEQDLSESVLEFDRLEGQVKKLRRKSDAIVANDGGAAKSSIMQQLAMIRRKQEELIRLQDALQCQLNKQVGKSEGRVTEHCQEEGDVASSDPHQTSEGEKCNSRTEHITELMEDIQLRSSDAVREEGSPPENRGDAPIVSHSPVVIVMESDAKSNAVTTPPTIQQRELLGIPLVTQGFGSSLLPFPQTPLRNSHYSPFVARFSGSDGSVLCTPSTPGSYLGMDYYDQAVFSPKSLMAGSAQILSPINESFPIQLPLAMFTPSPIKLGRNVAPVASRKLPVANLTRRLNDTLENFESMTPSPKVKRHSPLPRVVAPSVGTLSLAGNLAPHHRRNPRHQGALTSVRDKILGSAAHRYCEALLDEEVALFACRLHVTLGLAPLLITRCTDPVASVLEEGDDQHFVPICDSPLRSPPFSSAFSAFSNVIH